MFKRDPFQRETKAKDIAELAKRIHELLVRFPDHLSKYNVAVSKEEKKMANYLKAEEPFNQLSQISQLMANITKNAVV